MKANLFSLVAVALLSSSLWGDDAKLNSVPAAKAPPTACHGTAIEFVASPGEAAKLAAAQKKLVLVLHVSGYFEDPDFT